MKAHIFIPLRGINFAEAEFLTYNNRKSYINSIADENILQMIWQSRSTLNALSTLGARSSWWTTSKVVICNNEISRFTAVAKSESNIQMYDSSSHQLSETKDTAMQ